MKLVLTITLLTVGAFAFGQSSGAKQAYADSSHLTGVWRGQQGDGKPVVILVVSDESGSLSGAVLFYFLTRKTENDPWTSTPGLPEPIFNLRRDGDTIHFDVSHRRAHPPRSLNDPPVSFALALTGPDAGRLTNDSEPSAGLLMVRSDY